MADPKIRAYEPQYKRQQRADAAGVGIDVQREFIEAIRAQQAGDPEGMAKVAEAMRKAGRELPQDDAAMRQAIKQMMDDVIEYGSGAPGYKKGAKDQKKTVESLFADAIENFQSPINRQEIREEMAANKREKQAATDAKAAPRVPPNAAGRVDDVFGPRPPNFTLTGGNLPQTTDTPNQQQFRGAGFRREDDVLGQRQRDFTMPGYEQRPAQNLPIPARPQNRTPTAPEVFEADVAFDPPRGTIVDRGQKALPPGQEVPLLTGPPPIQTSGVGPDKPGSGMPPGVKPLRSPIGRAIDFGARNAVPLAGGTLATTALGYSVSGDPPPVADLASTEQPPQNDPVVEAAMPTGPRFDTSARDEEAEIMRRLANGGRGRTPVATMDSVFGDAGVLPRRKLQFADIPELPVEQQLDDTAVREAIEKARFNEVSMDDIRDPGGFFDAYIKSGNTGEDVQRAAVALARASQGNNIGEILGGVLSGYDDMVREDREGEFERRVAAEQRRAQFAGKMADYEMKMQQLRQQYADAKTKVERDRILARTDLLNESIAKEYQANNAADLAEYKARRDTVGDINANNRLVAQQAGADLRTAAGLASGAAGREERRELEMRAALEREAARQPRISTPREFILASIYGDPKQTGMTPEQQLRRRAIYEKMSEDIEGFSVYEIPDDPVAADLYLREAINNVRSGTRNWLVGLDENEKAQIGNLEQMRRQFGQMAVQGMGQ